MHILLLLLGHIAALARCGSLLQMEQCVTSSVACRSVTTVSPAKMAEPIEMPFRMWTRGAQGTMY